MVSQISKLSSNSSYKTLFAAALLWTAAAFVSHALRGMGAAFVEPPRSQQERAHPRLVQFIALSQVSAAVDALWIRVLQDPAIQHVSRGEHASVYWDLDLLTELDPAFFEAYISGAQLLAVIRNDGLGAWKILEKAEKFRQTEFPNRDPEFQARYWRDPWRLALARGYVALFELGDLDLAETAFRTAGEYPEAPEYLKSMRERLSHPGGKYEVGIRVVRFILSGQLDDTARESMEKKLRALILTQHLFHAERDFKEFLIRQPSYRNSGHVPVAQLQKYWSAFKDREPAFARDPLGGTVSVGAAGKLETTSPFEPVFRLELSTR